MPVAEQEQTEEHEQPDSSSGSRTALRAAAAAAATGAASYAVKKALSRSGNDGAGEHDTHGESDNGGGRPQRRGGDTTSVVSSALASAWESASDVVLPMAEDAVAAAGRYLAEHAPEVVRERLVPRFIEAFNDAS
jgi:hypothetical protein